MESSQIKVGDKVNRVNHRQGQYKFPGEVVAVFPNKFGYVYAVVQMDKYNLLHIFRLDDIELR